MAPAPGHPETRRTSRARDRDGALSAQSDPNSAADEKSGSIATLSCRPPSTEHHVMGLSRRTALGNRGAPYRRFALVADGHDWLSLPLNVEVAALFLLAGRDRS